MPTQITIPAPLGASIAGPNSFAAPKQLQIAIALAGGGSALQPIAFTGTGGSTLRITNARASARIVFAGNLRGTPADVSIWGLSQNFMNQFQTLGVEINKIARNILSIFAGDAVTGFSRVFTGNIIQAWGDYNAAPDVAMRFSCVAGYLEGTQPFASTTFTGKVPIVQIFQSIAQQAGWGFFNNGVDQTIALSNPYYSGSAVDQFRKVAEDVRVNAMLLPGNQAGQNYVLTTWPKGGAGGSGNVPVISRQTGMIGYPTYQQNGMIMVRTLFNPQITMGNRIQVNSALFENQSLAALPTNPNSLWVVTRVDHALDTLIPKGQWMTTVFAAVNAPFKPPILPPPP